MNCHFQLSAIIIRKGKDNKRLYFKEFLLEKRKEITPAVSTYLLKQAVEMAANIREPVTQQHVMYVQYI